MFVVPNDFLLFCLCAPLALQMYATTESRYAASLSCIYLSFTAIVAVVIESRSAILLLFLAFVLRGYHKPQSCMTKALLVGASTMSVVFATGFDKPLTGFTMRIELWWITIDLSSLRPFFGLGPGNFGAYYSLHPLQVHAADHRQMDWPHNVFLETLFEQGMIGLLILLALFFIAIRSAKHRGSSSQWNLDSLILFALAGAIELSLNRPWVPAAFLLLSSYAFREPRRKGE